MLWQWVVEDRAEYCVSLFVSWDILGLQPKSYEIYFAPVLRAFTATPQVKVWGSDDKSLALPGRKQATATKHRIYSPYSTRNSI